VTDPAVAALLQRH